MGSILSVTAGYGLRVNLGENSEFDFRNLPYLRQFAFGEYGDAMNHYEVADYASEDLKNLRYEVFSLPYWDGPFVFFAKSTVHSGFDDMLSISEKDITSPNPVELDELRSLSVRFDINFDLKFHIVASYG